MSQSIDLEELQRLVGLQTKFLMELSGRAEALYDEFDRRKSDGSIRKIAASTGSLKIAQKWLLQNFFYKFQMPEYLHGSIPGRSIVTNASAHVGKEVVINIDLHNFFGSITSEMILETLRRYPFDEAVISLLVSLVTYKGTLPQGAPTSPAIANLVGFVIDAAILNVLETSAHRGQVSYTRYVDDITISGPAGIADLLPSVFSAVRGSGFKLNSRKVRVQRRSTRQSVTGVVVNEFKNVPKGLIRKLRQDLYFCQRYGLQEHCRRVGQEPESFLSSIDGRIAFLKMTRPELAAEMKVKLDFCAGRGLDGMRKEASSPIEVLDSNCLDVLNQLEFAVKAGTTVRFSYEANTRVVAPSESFISSAGKFIVKGFQLSPVQGWRTFEVSLIRELSTYES